MKFYKWLLRFVQLAVVLVVLPRVASFVALLGYNETGFDIHDLIRYSFAGLLGLGTIATAYFSENVDPPEYDDEPSNSREQKRREKEAVYFAAMNNAAPFASRALIVFAFLDGTFNLADAMYGANLTGILDPSQGMLYYVYATATFFFGVSPTILSIMLARLISATDRIPEGFEKTANRRQVDILRTVMGNLGLREYKSSDTVQLLNGGSNATEQPDARTERIMSYSPNGNGEQAERITNYLNSQQWQELPSITKIQEALGDPVPSRSTVSTVRRKWMEALNA